MQSSCPDESKKMAHEHFHWLDEAIEHLAQHDVAPEEFVTAFENRIQDTQSRSTGRPAFYGYDDRGRLLFGVYERISEFEILPKTAFEVSE